MARSSGTTLPASWPLAPCDPISIMCDAVTINSLSRLATAMRTIFEEYSRTTNDARFENFPRGTCGIMAELLGRYLVELGIPNVMYVYGTRGSGESRESHAWIEINSTIVDITADQFGQSAVIVAHQSAWHSEWKREPPRPPICDSASWPLYPFAAWQAVIDGMGQIG